MLVEKLTGNSLHKEHRRSSKLTTFLLGTIALLLLGIMICLAVLVVKIQAVETNSVLNPAKAADALSAAMPSLTGFTQTTLAAVLTKTLRKAEFMRANITSTSKLAKSLGCSDQTTCATTSDDLTGPDFAAFMNAFGAQSTMISNILPVNPTAPPAEEPHSADVFGLGNVAAWVSQQFKAEAWKPLAVAARNFINDDLMKASAISPPYMDYQCGNDPNNPGTCSWVTQQGQDKTEDFHKFLTKFADFCTKIINMADAESAKREL